LFVFIFFIYYVSRATKKTGERLVSHSPGSGQFGTTILRFRPYLPLAGGDLAGAEEAVAVPDADAEEAAAVAEVVVVVD
jgi:hypothetical protein